jgi:hypothetical protein
VLASADVARMTHFTYNIKKMFTNVHSSERLGLPPDSNTTVILPWFKREIVHFLFHIKLSIQFLEIYA